MITTARHQVRAISTESAVPDPALVRVQRRFEEEGGVEFGVGGVGGLGREEEGGGGLGGGVVIGVDIVVVVVMMGRWMVFLRGCGGGERGV